MFLAAAPYFQDRFSSSTWIHDHFQSAQISVSTITNLGSMIVLTKLQENASYPKRIAVALVLNFISFLLLAISTLFKTTATIYFGFMLVMVFVASLATGLIQNGVFSYVTGFGRNEYTQSIMTGQAVAGVLPCIAQIATVLAAPSGKSHGLQNGTRQPHSPLEDSPSPSLEASSTSAFAFFLTATAISVLALLSFVYLLRRRAAVNQNFMSSPKPLSPANLTSSGELPRKPVGLWALFRKLPLLSTSVFLCFAITMTFPVFTTQIVSVNPETFPSPVFIPLAFLLWNTGDLLGRLLTVSSTLSLTHYPFALFTLAIARVIFIPLYFLCNIRGDGAVIPSDAFYLVVVQGLFGLSNGYLGSSCMMAAGEWVAEEEKEAAGGFMGLSLVGGLTVGSLLSFFVGGI